MEEMGFRIKAKEDQFMEEMGFRIPPPLRTVRRGRSLDSRAPPLGGHLLGGAGGEKTAGAEKPTRQPRSRRPSPLPASPLPASAVLSASGEREPGRYWRAREDEAMVRRSREGPSREGRRRAGEATRDMGGTGGRAVRGSRSSADAVLLSRDTSPPGSSLSYHSTALAQLRGRSPYRGTPPPPPPHAGIGLDGASSNSPAYAPWRGR